MERITITETGCYLDSHRGHYMTRDMIWLAEEFGFIVGLSDKFVLAKYEECSHEKDYPYEVLVELADEARDWLNCGDNEGIDRAIKGQNSPPIIPEGHGWEWLDGDFGLYPYVLFNIGYEDNTGTVSIAKDATMPEARAYLKARGAKDDVIERLLGQSPEDMALQAGGFIVEAIEASAF